MRFFFASQRQIEHLDATALGGSLGYLFDYCAEFAVILVLLDAHVKRGLNPIAGYLLTAPRI